MYNLVENNTFFIRIRPKLLFTHMFAAYKLWQILCFLLFVSMTIYLIDAQIWMSSIRKTNTTRCSAYLFHNETMLEVAEASASVFDCFQKQIILKRIYLKFLIFTFYLEQSHLADLIRPFVSRNSLNYKYSIIFSKIVSKNIYSLTLISLNPLVWSISWALGANSFWAKLKTVCLSFKKNNYFCSCLCVITNKVYFFLVVIQTEYVVVYWVIFGII